MKKLFLLDAFALIYRAYFAFSKNPLINSKGMNVSAVQGFCNTLVDILKKEKPTHLAVCFDTKAPTERHTDFADYKAHRQAQPEDITISIPYIKAILEAMNIACIEKDGFEADDVVGTIALQAGEQGYKVFMVTPDKDYGQLVTENVFIYKPPYMGNTFEILGVEDIKKKWEISDVKQVVEILGLMGDASDNIPGLPGVGEKTAKKYIQEYGTIENLLANADKLKGKAKENVENNKEIALLSKKLATIITNVPITWSEESLVIKEVNKELLTPIFHELEFRTLGKRIIGEEYQIQNNSDNSINVFEKKNDSQLAKESSNNDSNVQKNLFGEDVITETEVEERISVAGKNITNTEHEYILCDTEEKINDLVNQLQKSSTFCFDTESTDVDPNIAELVGLSFSVEVGKAYYVPLSDNREECLKSLEYFKSILEDKSKEIIGQNIKYDLLLLKWYGIELKGKIFDTMLAHYLLEPDMRHGMDFLSETYLGYKPISITELIGKKGKNQLSMRTVEVQKACDYAAEDADITLQLKEYFAPKIKEAEAEKLLNEVEVPLISVLCDMESEGVKIDSDFLKNLSSKLETEIIETEKIVYELAGVKFNLASPKQLGEVLFDKIKIPYIGKKTKTGQYSTDEEMLSRLVHEYPIAAAIQNFRELSKLKSTYVDAIPALINPKTKRVHTSFNQAVASTGRLSSTDPNLQNIPIRTERGREIRKAFIARDEDHVLLSADYSQIELRIIASLSEDENMMNAFFNKQDVHAATASKVFNVPLEEVSRDMRSKAKAVNFGIAYGQTAFGLSQNLGITRTEAKEIIDNYNAKFPGVKKLMDYNINFAREYGYAQTIMGRRRYLRDINSANATVRGFAERNAINAPIQGSAADMIKVAMIRIHNIFKKEKFKSRMTLQVHDELVFDVHKAELEIIKPIIEKEMAGAMPLKVPVEVGMGVGANWLDAH
jgi:DNA polymerase-1